jgi:hypothetical protein
MQIRDPGWKQFGSRMEKSRIRDKHPGPNTEKKYELFSPSVIFQTRRSCQNSFTFTDSELWGKYGELGTRFKEKYLAFYVYFT